MFRYLFGPGIALSLLLGLGFAIPLLTMSPKVAAHDFKLKSLIIHQPWARASAGPARAGAVYFTVENTGAGGDRLLAAGTPAAKRAELHGHIAQDGIMKMRPVEAVDLPAKETATLEPGGVHVMLMGLAAPLKEGESFPVTLTFEKAGSIKVDVAIKAVGAMGSADATMHGGKHKKH